MFGGIAVARNLLCLGYTEARGRIVLVDLDEQRPMSSWEYGDETGYADAGGVAMAADFSIFVADARNDVVRRFTAFGKEIGRLGISAERGPGAAGRDRPGVLDRPHGVAAFDGRVWITCGERALRSGVQCFGHDGRVLDPLRAFGEERAKFGGPRGVWADSRGVLVADTLHGVVQQFALDGRYIGAFKTSSSPDEASRPVAVVRLGSGVIVVADRGDRHRIARFDSGGEPAGELAADSPGAELREPVGLARDEERVYVLDRDGERVQRFDSELRSDGWTFDLAEIEGAP